MGNDFRIRQEVKLRNDGSYLNIEYDKCFAKKITSRAFPVLIGKDQWKSEGVQILGLLNLLEKDDDIDPFYLFRGDVAEHFVGSLVAEYFGNKYGKENVEVIIFGDKQFTYGDQWYYDKTTEKGNKDFGGRMDIGIRVKGIGIDGADVVFVIEVKSKTHTVYNYVEVANETTHETTTNTVIKKSDYQTIAVDKQYPETETYQGIFLGNMGNQSQVTMFWVFFNEKQEAQLRELLAEYLITHEIPQLPFDYHDVVYHQALIKFDRKEIWRDMLVASNSLKLCAKEKRIPLHLFNTKFDLPKLDHHIAEYERIECLKQEGKDEAEPDFYDVQSMAAEEDLPF